MHAMISPEEKVILLIGLSKNSLACTLTEQSATYTDTKPLGTKIQSNRWWET